MSALRKKDNIANILLSCDHGYLTYAPRQNKKLIMSRVISFFFVLYLISSIDTIIFNFIYGILGLSKY